MNLARMLLAALAGHVGALVALLLGSGASCAGRQTTQRRMTRPSRGRICPRRVFGVHSHARDREGERRMPGQRCRRRVGGARCLGQSDVWRGRNQHLNWCITGRAAASSRVHCRGGLLQQLRKHTALPQPGGDLNRPAREETCEQAAARASHQQQRGAATNHVTTQLSKL